MNYYANAINMVGLATYAAATSSLGFHMGEYISGVLIVHVKTLSGVGARAYPTWQVSADATGARSGRYVSLKAFATSLRATGLAVLTLPFIGRWCRVGLTFGGTTPSSKLTAWGILKGQT